MEVDGAGENPTMDQLMNVLSQSIQSNNAVINQLATRSLAGSNNVREKISSLPEYDGEASTFDDWSFRVNMALMAGNVIPPRSFYLILSALKGNAVTMAKHLEERITRFFTTEEFLKALREIFVSPAHKAISRAKFQSRIQLESENLATYHGLLKTLFRESYDENQCDESILIDKFVKGLRSKALKRKIMDLDVIGQYPTTYGDCLTKAMGYQAKYETLQFGNTPGFSRSNNFGSEPMELGAMKFKKQQQKYQKDSKEFLGSKDSKEMVCFKCNKKGHIKKDCKIKFLCNFCKKEGHLEANCFKKKKVNQSQTNPLN